MDVRKSALESLVIKKNHFFRDADDVISGLGMLNKRFGGKRILLTGAAGFLGAQFIHYFMALNESDGFERPCKLTGTDNFLRGYPTWMQTFSRRDDFQVREENIVTQREFSHYDYIIHAASVASPTYYRKYPIETMDANVIGLRNLLNHAVINPPEGFLYFSTSEIYGDPDPANIPTKELYRGNVSCTGPRACYDESKRFGETMCVNFFRVHKIPVVIVRPFNNYGPGLHISDRRVIPDFFRDALAGRNIVLLSDGQATRTFCYVSDALEGYLRALLLGARGESYNIGSESPEISMTELAKQVIDAVGANVKVEVQKSPDRDYTTDNPKRRCPDISKARKDIKYNPRISLKEGLGRTFAYYQENSSES